MRAGKMDRTIALQRSATVIDAAGVPQPTWSTIATVRAEVVSSTSVEFIRAYGASDETETLFRLRFVDGITNADRILFDGTEFNIKAVTELRRRRGLEIRATVLEAS